MGERRVRRLVVDGTTWRWSVRHHHRGHQPCAEVLSLYRAAPRGSLRLVFREGPGRFAPAGYPATASGHVALGDGPAVNLHEPGTVRLLLETVVERGLLPESPAGRELDGWQVLAAMAGGAGPADDAV